MDNVVISHYILIRHTPENVAFGPIGYIYASTSDMGDGWICIQDGINARVGEYPALDSLFPHLIHDGVLQIPSFEGFEIAGKHYPGDELLSYGAFGKMGGIA